MTATGSVLLTVSALQGGQDKVGSTKDVDLPATADFL